MDDGDFIASKIFCIVVNAVTDDSTKKFASGKSSQPLRLSSTKQSIRRIPHLPPASFSFNEAESMIEAQGRLNSDTETGRKFQVLAGFQSLIRYGRNFKFAAEVSPLSRPDVVSDSIISIHSLH